MSEDDTRAAPKRLTKGMVETLAVGSLIWDSEVGGFGARRQAGRPIYVLKYRQGGRQRWFTIGPHGQQWTLEEARKRARALRGAIADGKDPAAVRDHEKTIPTVQQVADQFLSEHVETKLKPRTIDGYRRIITKDIVPALGRIRIDKVNRSDVAKWHHAMRATPRKANLDVAVLSKILTWATLRGLREDPANPCRGIGKNRESSRERFLSEIELSRLGAVLAAAEARNEAVKASEAEIDNHRRLAQNARVRGDTKAAAAAKHEIAQIRRQNADLGDAVSPEAIAAIRLLILTGARLSEVLTARWEWIDLTRGTLRLPDSKTGAKTIHLNAPARALLADLPRLNSNPHVITGEKPGAHLVNLEKPWRRVREAATVIAWRHATAPEIAGLIKQIDDRMTRPPTFTECQKAAREAGIELPVGLIDVRLHDLRHSFASIGAASGMSLPIIGSLLGHTQAATTMRYAHLSADPQAAAADAIGARIDAAMNPKNDRAAGAEIVEIATSRKPG